MINVEYADEDRVPDVKPLDLVNKRSYLRLIDAILEKVRNVDPSKRRGDISRAFVGHYNALVAMNHLAEEYERISETVENFLELEYSWSRGENAHKQYGPMGIPITSYLVGSDPITPVGTVRNQTVRVVKFDDRWYNALLCVEYELWRHQEGIRDFTHREVGLPRKNLWRFRKYCFDQLKKLGKTITLTWFSLFNQLILPEFAPNPHSGTMPDNIIAKMKKLKVFEATRRMMNVPPKEVEFCKRWPLDLSIAMSGKHSAPGGFMRGDKSGWNEFYWWLFEKYPNDFHYLMTFNKDHAFSYRNEVWGKQRVIDMSNAIRNIGWHSICQPLMEILQASTVYYGRSPRGLDDLLTKIMVDKKCSYSASLDFVDYGPTTSFKTWEIGITLMEPYLNNVEDRAYWRRAVMDMQVHRLILPVYQQASYSLNTSGVKTLSCVVSHPAYGLVTGCWPHNVCGTATSVTVAVYCALKCEIPMSDFHVLGMVDDLCVFFKKNHQRKQFLGLWLQTCEECGLRTQKSKTEIINNAAILQKNMWNPGYGMIKTPARLTGNSIRREPIGAINNRLTHCMGLADKWITAPKLFHKIYYQMCECSEDLLRPMTALRNLNAEDLALVRSLMGTNYVRQVELADDNWHAVYHSGAEIMQRSSYWYGQIPKLVREGVFNTNPLAIHKWTRRSMEIKGDASDWFQNSIEYLTRFAHYGENPNTHFIYADWWEEEAIPTEVPNVGPTVKIVYRRRR